MNIKEKQVLELINIKNSIHKRNLENLYISESMARRILAKEVVSGLRQLGYR